MKKRAEQDSTPHEQLGSVCEVLGQLADRLGTHPPPADTLAGLVEQTRTAERLCTAVIVGLATAARTHSQAGLCAPPETMLQAGNATTDTQAVKDTRRAKTAATFPHVGAAITAGAAYPENIDILTRTTAMMSPEETQAITEHDSVLAEAASRLGADSFRKRLQRLRDKIRDDNGDTATEQANAQTRANVSPSRDNLTYRLTAVFNALNGEAVSNAHRAEVRRLSREHGTNHGLTTDQLNVDALSNLIIRGSKVQSTGENNTPQVTVNVLTDRDTLTHGPHPHSVTETFNAMPLSTGTIARLCCDATIRRIDTLPDSRVNASKTSRTATDAQRAALRALYNSCPISGTSWAHIEIHHVTFVENGGETILNNLIPLSRRWHHLVHDEGWGLTMDPNRTLHLYQPNGTHHKTIQPPTPALHQTHELQAA